MTRYYNGINIIGLASVGEFDYNDCAILWFILKFMESGKMIACIINNKKYYWIMYNHIIDNLPLLPTKTVRGLQKRMQKYIQYKLMEKETLHELENRKGTFALYRFTEKMEQVIAPYSEEIFQQKEKEIRQIKKQSKKICAPSELQSPTLTNSSHLPSRTPVTSKDDKINNYKINDELMQQVADKSPIFKNPSFLQENEKNNSSVRKLNNITLQVAQMWKDMSFPVRIPEPGQPPSKTLLQVQEYLHQLQSTSFDVYNSIDTDWRIKNNIKIPCNMKQDEFLAAIQLSLERYKEMHKKEIWPENKKFLTDSISLWFYSPKNQKSWFLYCYCNEPKNINEKQMRAHRIRDRIFPDTKTGREEKERAIKFRLPEWDELKYWHEVKEMYEWWQPRCEAFRYYNNFSNDVQDFDILLKRMQEYRETWENPWTLGNFGLDNKTWKLFVDWLYTERGYNIKVDEEALFMRVHRRYRDEGRRVAYYEELEKLAREYVCV